MSDTYLDELNRREIQLSRFASYLLKEYSYPNLEQAYKDARLILLDAESITSRAKLNKVLAEINRTITPVTAGMWEDINGELSNFSIDEAAFQAALLTEFAPVDIKTPAKKLVEQYINTSIMSLESGSASTAGVWADFVKANTDDLTNTIRAQITAGYANGESVQQISKRVLAATEGVSKNSADRLVRTGVQFHAQQARAAMRDDPKNAEALEGAREIPVTTWDSRRSLICTSIEAKYGKKGWPVGKSPIGYPPYHFFCRTTTSILPKGVELEGTRPAIAGRKGKEAEESFERREKLAENRGSTVVKYSGRKDKAFVAEQVKVSTPMSKFLRDSPYWYTKQLLGKTRADAFLSGKLDLSKLTDRDLSPLSLAGLGLD